MRNIITVIAMLLAPAASAQGEVHDLIKAAAAGIVANENCSSALFNEVMIVAWIRTAGRESGYTDEQAIVVTRMYIQAIKSNIRTTAQLAEFCRDMSAAVGEPT